MNVFPVHRQADSNHKSKTGTLLLETTLAMRDVEASWWSWSLRPPDGCSSFSNTRMGRPTLFGQAPQNFSLASDGIHLPNERTDSISNLGGAWKVRDKADDGRWKVVSWRIGAAAISVPFLLF